MSDNSKIEWTDASWNPIRARNLKTGKIGWHCEHVTTGCEFCYSERINKRRGTGLPFKPGHRNDVEIFLDDKMLLAPLRWKKPRMVFVGSMTDLFADFVKDEWLDEIFAVMALAPQHTFQCLTKRAERMREYFATPHSAPNVKAWQARVCEAVDGFVPVRTDPSREAKLKSIAGPLPNVWLGVSAERQQEADERIPLLLQTPAAIRFVSLEPLLVPIDLAHVNQGQRWFDAFAGSDHCLDWVIVGGESGQHARPMHPQWARAIRDQCQAAGVAFFYKQAGEWALKRNGDGWQLNKDHIVFEGDTPKLYRGGPPGGMTAPQEFLERVGKKAAGRLLDGREWNEFPAIAAKAEAA